MKCGLKKPVHWNYLAMAFAIPVVGMLTVMLISQFEPFGKYAILYSDMYHQYFPFFVAFRKAILNGESLLWSWNVGLGMDYLGLIAYYLASPLNLLSILVPEGLLLEFFALLVPVRLGLASLFFAIFLKEMFGRYDWSVSVFGAFYGLCAWSLGYLWNIMWLDTFALLPLVALGTVRLLRDRKFILYTVVLFLSVFSTSVAYLIMNFASNYLTAARFSAFTNLSTVVTVMAGVLILREPFLPIIVPTTAMIIVGVWGVQKFTPEYFRNKKQASE